MNKITRPHWNGFSGFFSKITLLLFFCIACTFSSKAQVSAYTFSETTGASYTDLTTGTILSNGAVTCSGTFVALPAFVTYTLPFTFYYNNIGYNSVNMSDNGFIVLGTAGTAAANNTTPISGTTTNSSAISCYGMNLVGATASAEIKYDVIGTAPNRVFVIQYKDVQRRPSLTALPGLLNMQIRLSETTGLIEIIYRDFSTASATPTTGQVGLRGTTNSDFSSRKNTGTSWTPTSSTPANTDAMQLSNTIGFSAGTKFTWTPCFDISNLDITFTSTDPTITVNATWNCPVIVPGGGTDWEVRTSGNPGSGPAGLFASGNTLNCSVSIPGIEIGIAYEIYVKSHCRSVWQVHRGFLTSCATVFSLPYIRDFENLSVPAIPNCESVVTPSGSPMATVNNTNVNSYGFNSKNLTTTGSSAQNAWYFLRPVYFSAGVNYKLSYKYGGTREQSFFQQKMKVYVGTAPSVVGMTTLLADHQNIITSPNTNIVNFTVNATGIYYIGFYANAAANQGHLQLDDITLDYATCAPPTNLTSGQVSSSSAVITWTAPSGNPNTYEYYMSTSASQLSDLPTNTTIPTGQTTSGNVLAFLSGLNPSTTYYIWVRSLCSTNPDDYSPWSIPTTFTTSALISYCSPNGSSFPQDPNGITNVTMGSINNTTGIETNNYGDYTNFSTNVAQQAIVPVFITYQTGFTYETTIWVDWNNDGDFADMGETVYQGVSANASPTTLSASFTVPTLDSNANSTLGPHRVRIGGIDNPSVGGPMTPCRNGNYQAFEDYTIYVTVTPPPLTISDGTPGSTSTTICSGESTSNIVFVTSPIANFQVYAWSPSTSVTGNAITGYVFNPTVTTTYILTATQTSGNFSSNSVSYTVYVNQPPTPIVVSPASVTICQSDSLGTALVATGGIVPGMSTTVLNEDFNGATISFTTVNNSFAGIPANATWTAHSSPFAMATEIINNNDNTKFYQSNSDSQGGGTTNTELISPVFSLAGMSDASLSFWHYYRASSSGIATVEISTDGGTVYTILPTTSWTTTSQGSAAAFVNKIINLSPYVGMSNLKIKFKYTNAVNAWYWNIDNVKVTGATASNITWSPVFAGNGLYNDAALTTPYTGTATSTVYARPTSTRTYTATSESPEGCNTSTDVTVTVSPISGGTTSGNQTVNCTSPTISAITLSGHNGTIVKWQYSSSPSFLSGVTDIPNTATVLNAATIGTLTATRYYRAVVVNGVCTAYSTTSAIIVSAGATNTTTLTVIAASYTWPVNGETYTASGTYMSVSGCNTEILVLTLSPCSDTTFDFPVIACDSFYWEETGETYTISGDYTHVTTVAGGCTHTVTLHLTIVSSAILVQPEDTSICGAVGSVASMSVVTAMPAAMFQWQYRVVNGANPNPAWITITSALNAVYSNFNTSTLGITRTSNMPAAGTQYRAVINGYCGTIESDSAKIIVVALVKAGTITSPTSVCTGDDITFTLGNYAGTSIQWQSAPIASGTFTDIPGAIEPTYTLTAASAASDKSYRAIVTSSCNNTAATTATKTITVNPLSASGGVTGGGIVCAGSSGTLKVIGNVGTIQWQYSLDGIIYIDAPKVTTIPVGFTAFSTTSTSAASGTYMVTAITEDVSFRVKVTNGVCSSAYSNEVDYVLETTAIPGTITSEATGPICKGTGTTLTLSGASGIITWEKSTNWQTATTPTWTATTNHSTTLATGNLNSATAYRAKVTIGSCSIVYADYVPVLLVAAPIAKAITVNTTSPAGTNVATALCTSSTAKILTEGTGYVGDIQWQWSTTSTTTSFTDIAGATGVNYTIANPSVGANYYRVKLSNSCGLSVFSAVKVVYYKACALRKVESEFEATAYPNPYKGSFSLNVTTSSEENIHVSVYDMTGRLIEKRETASVSASGIQLGERYPSGVYNVVVTQGSDIKTLRVVKQ